MSELRDKITSVCRNWGRKVAQDLKASLEKALKDGQPLRNNPEEASLNFKEDVIVDEYGNAKIQIIATDEYWVNIEDGRGAGKYMPPKAIGAKWQGKNNIPTKKILAEIEAKVKTKYSRLTKQSKRLSKPKKELSYSDAAKKLSYIFASAITRDGIKPKPFVDRVITSERLNELTSNLSLVIGKTITSELNLNNEYKNIKIKI